jgi:hypothetical protein
VRAGNAGNQRVCEKRSFAIDKIALNFGGLFKKNAGASSCGNRKSSAQEQRAFGSD